MKDVVLDAPTNHLLTIFAETIVFYRRNTFFPLVNLL